MKKKVKRNFLDVLIFIFGLFFVLLGIAAIINSFLHPEVANFLWLCYLSLILIGVGMILRNSYLIVMQLNITLIPLLFWNVDFLYQLFSDKSLFGVTDYFFAGGINSLGNFVTLQHVYILPLAIYAVYRFGVKSKKIWIASYVEASVVFFLSFFFTDFERNTNCAFASCLDFIKITGVWYSVLWFATVFAMVYLVNYCFVKLFYGRK